MNWLLPDLTTAQLAAHLATCHRVAARGDMRKIAFARCYDEPKPRPTEGEHLYVRCDGTVIGYHYVIGTNRHYNSVQTFDHWQILCKPEFHRLDSCHPAPAVRGLIVYNPPSAPPVRP